jgi:putative ABC transport system substrate-binding protein
MGERLLKLSSHNGSQWRAAGQPSRAGGLLTYGPSIDHGVQRAASYVDRILKGMKPGELPVEQPTLVELVINRKTADALGLAMPPSILAQATEMIQ